VEGLVRNVRQFSSSTADFWESYKEGTFN